MSSLSGEAWATIGIVAALFLGGTVGRVWRPLRKTVAAVDVLSGRPPRYPGDPEERPGLAERLDRIDSAIGELTTNVNGVRSELEAVKEHVQSVEVETEHE